MARIKHWSGYGTVYAEVTARGNYFKEIYIHGEHERGLDFSWHDVTGSYYAGKCFRSRASG